MREVARQDGARRAGKKRGEDDDRANGDEAAQEAHKATEDAAVRRGRGDTRRDGTGGPGSGEAVWVSGGVVFGASLRATQGARASIVVTVSWFLTMASLGTDVGTSIVDTASPLTAGVAANSLAAAASSSRRIEAKP